MNNTNISLCFNSSKRLCVISTDVLNNNLECQPLIIKTEDFTYFHKISLTNFINHGNYDYNGHKKVVKFTKELNYFRKHILKTQFQNHINDIIKISSDKINDVSGYLYMALDGDVKYISEIDNLPLYWIAYKNIKTENIVYNDKYVKLIIHDYKKKQNEKLSNNKLEFDKGLFIDNNRNRCYVQNDYEQNTIGLRPLIIKTKSCTYFYTRLLNDMIDLEKTRHYGPILDPKEIFDDEIEFYKSKLKTDRDEIIKIYNTEINETGLYIIIDNTIIPSDRSKSPPANWIVNWEVDPFSKKEHVYYNKELIEKLFNEQCS